MYFTKNIWTDSWLWLQNPSSIYCKCLNMTLQAAESRKRCLDSEKICCKISYTILFSYFKEPQDCHSDFSKLCTFSQKCCSLRCLKRGETFLLIFFKCFFAGVHSSRLMFGPSHSFAPLPLFITFTRNVSSLISSTKDFEWLQQLEKDQHSSASN